MQLANLEGQDQTNAYEMAGGLSQGNSFAFARAKIFLEQLLQGKFGFKVWKSSHWKKTTVLKDVMMGIHPWVERNFFSQVVASFNGLVSLGHGSLFTVPAAASLGEKYFKQWPNSIICRFCVTAYLDHKLSIIGPRVVARDFLTSHNCPTKSVDVKKCLWKEFREEQECNFANCTVSNVQFTIM